MWNMGMSAAAALAGWTVLAGVAAAAPMAMDGPAAHRSAAGEPGDAARPARPVTVTMREAEDGRMLFAPATLQVRAGEQVRFRITNAGRTDHEFMLSTPAGNAAHKAMMARHPGLHHAEPDGTTLAPGAAADLVWRFTRPGTFEYACLIPGHYEAGMHGTVTVR